VATHGAEVARLVEQITVASDLPERYRALLGLAARWHDYGKAHPAFQGSIRSPERPARRDLAKAPNDAWHRSHRYRFPEGNERRPGFRHELASALSLFAVLSRHQPEHPALLGPWLTTLAALGETPERRANVPPPNACESEILALSSGDFDLVAYLVASHHGKVRCGLHAAPDDQQYRDRDGRGLPIRGVREGDELPETFLQEGAPPVPALLLTLEPAALGLSRRTGTSWAERVANLLECHGATNLAYLEACLRAADIRASQLDTPDPLILVEGQS
jgi:CRISPR-associated endonuclease/helicase Cas3